MNEAMELEEAVGTRVAGLLADELERASVSGEFGLIVQDVAPLHIGHLLNTLGTRKCIKSKSLRIAVVGEAAAIEAGKARLPAMKELLAADEETAVQWRNQRARTIAVVTSRPLAKAASMRDFRIVTEATLGQSLCAEQRDKAEVLWLRSLWEALEREKRLRISLRNSILFAEALEALSAHDRSSQAPKHLHLLGLFPDTHLADEKTDGKIRRRLNENRDLVASFRRAADEDWNRIRAYCKSLVGPAKTAANRLARTLRERKGEESLKGIDFANAMTLWKAKSPTTRFGGSTSGGVEREEIERAVGRLLMADDLAPLGDIAEEVTQVVQAALDDAGHGGTQDIKKGSSAEMVTTVSVDRDLLLLVRSRSTAKEWGGVIEVASDKPGALTEISAFKSWKPFLQEPIRLELAKFADPSVAIVPPLLLELLDRLAEHRAGLLPFACELALSPVSTLAGEPGLLAICEGYLKAYEDLLHQVHVCYPEMHGAADEEAEDALGRLLCLELYTYLKEDGEVEAVMSPLHPLYLWRSAAVVREVRGLGRTLSPREMETLEEACAEDTQFLQVLVIPKQATGSERPLMLGQAGMLGRLPIFREAPRGMLEADGFKTVADLGERIAKLRPFVRPGLQVVLVNLPHPNRFLAELVNRLDLENTSSKETYWGIHVRIRYTQADARGWGSETATLEDDLQEEVGRGEERGLLSLSVQNEIVPWEKFLKEMKDNPAHLTVVMDPFAVKSSPVARAQSHALNPWMPTCEYRFNAIRKEIQVIPVAEEHVFGSYLLAAGHIHTILQRKTPAHLPQVREVKETLDELALSSLWTVIADPHHVPLARLGEAEVIDRRIEGNRQLTCFSSDLSPFVKRLDGQLRQTHFKADAATLERLVRDLVAMEPMGVLGLAGTNQEKQVKGSLGKLIAVRWYRLQDPSGLAVSLDTPNAQRWLVAGAHSKEKADLLGLREEGGTLVLDIIEVKAYDEKVPYTVSDDGVIDGHCVGQVLATMQALAEVFSAKDVSPLAKPRREVLREHLYTALLRDQEPGYIERWHSLLQDVFDGKVPVQLSGRIIHVQLASVAPKASRILMSPLGIPIRVDTLSAEDVGLVLHPERRSKAEKGHLGDVLGEKDTTVIPWQVEPRLALERLLGQGGREVSGKGSDDDGDHLLGIVPDEPEPTAIGNPGGESPFKFRPEVLPADTEVESGRLQLDVLLGTEHASSVPVHWQPSRYSNGFFLILGASGSGKTECLKVLGTSIAAVGIPVLVFDFHGDVLLPNVRSVLLSSGSASTMGLNPLELDIHSAEESGLYDQRAALRGMIQRAVPALQHRQAKILRDAFEGAYQSAGILDDDTSTWSRPAPTFRDVIEILETWAEDDSRKSQRASIEGCLAAIQELFGHPIFHRESCISVDELLSGSTRLDLSKLPDQIRFIATESLLRKLFRVLKLHGPIPVQPTDDRERFRLFVVIDEAKILSLGNGDRDLAGNILNELITEARKFGLGMVLASQMVEHFSDEVRGNAATRLVLKPMDMSEAKKNGPNVSVDPEDLLQLAGKGDGYYRDRPSSRARRIQVRQMTTT